MRVGIRTGRGTWISFVSWRIDWFLLAATTIRRGKTKNRNRARAVLTTAYGPNSLKKLILLYN